LITIFGPNNLIQNIGVLLLQFFVIDQVVENESGPTKPQAINIDSSDNGIYFQSNITLLYFNDLKLIDYWRGKVFFPCQ
jgi:hypothetical protein